MTNETFLSDPPKRLVMPKSGSKPYSFGEPTWTKRLAIQVAAGAAIAGALIGGGLTFAITSIGTSNVTAAGATLGQVALTESQLRDQVISNKLNAYWVGPMDGAKYSLISNANGQVFVRYLPNGQGLEDTNADYRVIATYPQSDAFSITKAAGNQANAISFTNADGAQVFYSKTYAANVYVAFPDSPYEIEIFDPKDGGALNLATNAGTILKIK
jgi:hypothetical protein